MRLIPFPFVALAMMLAGLLGPVPAQAQPARVFVAAQGNDANPCTFAQPCRTFQKAHDTVVASGEIDVLDPAGYGTVNITKPISIQGHGFAGLAVPSGSGITINAGPNDRINLRGLLLDGVGTGSSGIKFITGGTLDLQECLIRNFGTYGIAFQPSGSSVLLVSDTHVAANGGDAIVVTPPSSGTLSGAFERVTLETSADGFLVAKSSSTATVNFTISDSTISNNVSAGVATNLGQTMVSRSTVINNNMGLAATGLNTIILATKSTITGNLFGLQTFTNGQIVSFGDNALAANGTDGMPTSTIPLK